MTAGSRSPKAGTAATPTTLAVTPAAETDSLARTYLGAEIMRLTNLDRVALGRQELVPDPLLTALARDARVACPGNSSLILRGRSRDMVDRGYFSHTVKGCRTTSGGPVGAAQLARRMGFTKWTVFGENIAWIMGIAGSKTYRTGCPQGGSTGCVGSTAAPLVIAAIQRMWMNSRDHRKNILDIRYSRFGCGAWHKAGSATVYATCIFSRGGSTAVDRRGPVFTDVIKPEAPLAPDGTFQFSATASDGAAAIALVSVSVDGATKAAWPLDAALASRGFTFALTAAGLSPGDHVLRWTARDAGANTSFVEVPFSVAAPDVGAPATP